MYRGLPSRALAISVGFQYGPIKGVAGESGDAGTDAIECSAGLRRVVEARGVGHEPCDRFTVASNDDLFALLDTVEEHAEFVLRFGRANFHTIQTSLS